MLEDIIRERKRKLEVYRKKANPYPARINRTAPLGEVRQRFRELQKSGDFFSVVGRITAFRNQGKIAFIDLVDESGKIQVILNVEETADFELLSETLDIGDFAEAEGTAFVTRKGEESVLAKRARIIVKSLRPIPSTFYGLKDIETRLRKRYLDMLVHPEIRSLFVKKSRFWKTVRDTLLEAGYLEVETPVLEPIPGGAEAEPFVTHMNALDRDFYLRISLELPLKRLLVGGYEKVFEIGRIFRNEGIDAEHLQDYTQMECYAAYEDYRGYMEFVERLYKRIVREVCGAEETVWRGIPLNWGAPWKKIEYYDVFQEYVGLDLRNASREELFCRAEQEGLEPETWAGEGRLTDLLFKRFVRPNLVQPSFLIHPPVFVEPLAKRCEDDPSRVERFQVMAAGTELGKGFSELNDPIDQRERFEEQARLRAQGDREAQMLDEDFLEALEYGMPPAAGFGMSERLFAVLMDKPVREAVMFPLMKKK